MWGMAAQLTDSAITEIAAYYAPQPPAPGKRRPRKPASKKPRLPPHPHPLPRPNPSFSPARHPVRALILVPTRELAMQVDESVRTYGRTVPLRPAVVYGGVPIEPQIKILRAGVEILVATPGRLLDHVGQRTVNLGQVEILVLDDATSAVDPRVEAQIHETLRREAIARRVVDHQQPERADRDREHEIRIGQPLDRLVQDSRRDEDAVDESVALEYLHQLNRNAVAIGERATG